MTVSQYDLSQINIAICALPILGGYGEDEFLTIERDGDDYSDTVTADGDVVRNRDYDQRATATLTLLASSAGNTVLSALSVLDTNSKNGLGVGAFGVVDANSLAAIYGAASCWIMRQPDVKFAKKVGVREWKIRIAALKSFTAGY